MQVSKGPQQKRLCSGTSLGDSGEKKSPLSIKLTVSSLHLLSLSAIYPGFCPSVNSNKHSTILKKKKSIESIHSALTHLKGNNPSILPHIPSQNPAVPLSQTLPLRTTEPSSKTRRVPSSGSESRLGAQSSSAFQCRRS